MGIFLGGSFHDLNPLGTPLTIESAEPFIFGAVLLNDWSARDLQAWEYVPLGPFTAKSFCTSISPWVVTYEALKLFSCASGEGVVQDNPSPLDYLQDKDYHRSFFDIKLEVCDEAYSLVSLTQFPH